MGIAQYYQPIYLFIVSLFSLQAYAKYKKRDVPMNERQTRTLNGECFILSPCGLLRERLMHSWLLQKDGI